MNLREALACRPPGWPEILDTPDPGWLLAKWRVKGDAQATAERLERALRDCEPRWREVGWDNSPYPDPKTWLGDGSTVSRAPYLEHPRWGIGYTDKAVLLRLFIPDPQRSVQHLTSLLPPRWETREYPDHVKSDELLKVIAEAAIPAIFPDGAPG